MSYSKISASKIFHRGSCTFTSKNGIDSLYSPPLNLWMLGWLMAFGRGAIKSPMVNFVRSFITIHSHNTKGSVMLPQLNLMIITLLNSLRASKRSGMMHSSKTPGPSCWPPFQSSTTNSQIWPLLMKKMQPGFYCTNIPHIHCLGIAQRCEALAKKLPKRPSLNA
jgi:hypothetical protein